MSLINQMLKDLDARRERENGSRWDEALQDLPSVAGKKAPSGRRLHVALAALVATGLLVLGIGLWRGRLRPAPSASANRPISSRKLAASATQKVGVPEGVSRKVVKREVPHREVASPQEAAGHRKAASPPVPSSAKSLVAVAPAPSRHRARPVKAFAPPKTVAVKGATVVPAHLPAHKAPVNATAAPQKPERKRLAKVLPTPVGQRRKSAVALRRQEGVAPGRLARVPHVATPQSEAEAAFRRGVADLRRGRDRSAEADLREALAEDAGQLKARRTLVAFLLQNGRISEAAGLLAGGIKVAPSYLPFREGYARILVGEGAWSTARAVLLQGGRPKLSRHPEFFALSAAISQRLGDYAAAADIYRKLVTLRPETGVWWMGLGLAQESRGKDNAAARAYRQAMACADLNVDLRRFVAAREAAIGEKPNSVKR